jgi:hypothetical protein
VGKCEFIQEFLSSINCYSSTISNFQHLNNVVKECENLGNATSPPAADVKCKSHFTGRMALCIFKYAMYPCPTSIATEECEKALKFFECTSTSTEVNY